MVKKADNAAKAAPEKSAIQAPAPAETEPAPVTYVVVSERRLNLRKGPGRDFSIMGTLSAGDVVTDAEMPAEYAIPGWTLVDTSIGRGWVKSEFIKVKE